MCHAAKRCQLARLLSSAQQAATGPLRVTFCSGQDAVISLYMTSNPLNDAASQAASKHSQGAWGPSSCTERPAGGSLNPGPHPPAAVTLCRQAGCWQASTCHSVPHQALAQHHLRQQGRQPSSSLTVEGHGALVVVTPQAPNHNGVLVLHRPTQPAGSASAASPVVCGTVGATPHTQDLDAAVTAQATYLVVWPACSCRGSPCETCQVVCLDPHVRAGPSAGRLEAQCPALTCSTGPEHPPAQAAP